MPSLRIIFLVHGFFIRQTSFYKPVNILKTGRYAKQKEKEGEKVPCSQLAVQIKADKKAPKDRHAQDDAHAADVRYLDEGFPCFLIHFGRRSPIMNLRESKQKSNCSGIGCRLQSNSLQPIVFPG